MTTTNMFLNFGGKWDSPPVLLCVCRRWFWVIKKGGYSRKGGGASHVVIYGRVGVNRLG